MASPAKDVRAIYSAYNIDKYQYVELKQSESYIQAKQKWLIFHSNTTDYTYINPLINKEVTSEVESV